MVKGFIRAARSFLFSRQAYKFVIRDWVALNDLDACSAVLNTMRFSENLVPQLMDGCRGRRLLVIAPHPDDEMLGPGGTLLKMVRRGAEVMVLYLTSGATHEMEVREAEAIDVGERCGFSCTFLRQKAGSLEASVDLADQLGACVRTFGPDTLFIPFVLDDHKDHRKASEILVRAFRTGAAAPSNLAVWAYQVYTALLPNVIVDITEVIDDKTEAISRYRSQMERRDWAHFARGLNAFNSRFCRGGGRARFVEAFFVLPLNDYVDLCALYFDRVVDDRERDLTS